MKTLTTLTAVAALIAGMSMASAQNAPASGSNMTQPPSSINKGSDPETSKSGSQGAGSAMSGNKSATSNTKATGSGKFCLESSPGGGLDCKFASMAACEKEGKVNNRQCSPNPNTGTTGQK
jgi:hypothetical protein